MLKSRSGDKIISGMNILHNNSDQLFSFLCENRRVESANLNLNDNKWNINSVKKFSYTLFRWRVAKRRNHQRMAKGDCSSYPMPSDICVQYIWTHRDELNLN